MREKIIESIEKERLIVIVRNIAGDRLLPLVKAMYDGGIRLLEITYSADGTGDNETANNIAIIKNHFGDKMFIGAGTVLTAGQVELTKKSGGEFIISPNVDKSVIKKTLQNGMVSIPGAYTPSEIRQAHVYGADFVKIFPVVNLGHDYIKNIRAPLSNIKMLAVGGINPENIKGYLNCGISGFGIGTNITDKKLIEEENYSELTALAKKYVLLLRG